MKSEERAQSRQRTGIVVSRGGLGGGFFIGLLISRKNVYSPYLHKVEQRRCAYFHFSLHEIGQAVFPIVVVQFCGKPTTPHADSAIGNGAYSAEGVEHGFSLVGISLNKTLHYIQLERADMVLFILL